MVLHARVVTGSGGGPDKTILRSVRYATQLRVSMGAAYIHPKDDSGISTLHDQADAWRCPFWPVPESGPFDPRTISALLRICKRKRVRVWHAHDYKSNLIGLLLKPLWPMKLVTTAHGWTRETARTKLYYHVDQWCLPRYDHVIAVSPKLKEHCLGLGIPEDRLTLIPNGIDLDESARRQTVEEARRGLGIDQSAKVIGVVARLSKEKGVDRAIRALGGIRRRLTNIQMLIVGDGPEGPSLRRLTERLKLGGAVRFCGWKKQTAAYFESMDMLLLPSRTEGLPNVLLEAMSFGVPCAATDVGAAREVLDDGRCGVILDPDCEQWARPIAACLRDPARLKQLQARAYRRVWDRFDFSDRMRRIGGVYDRLLGRQGNQEQTTTPYRRAA